MKEYIIQLKSADTPFTFLASSCYTKDGFCCFAYEKEGVKRVRKIPLCNIHSVDSEY